MTEMRMSASATAIAVAAAAIALLLVALAPAGAHAATIEIKGKTDKGLKFKGPDTVKPGENLKIENLTNPKKVGPHTFTLAEKKYLPETGKEIDACYAPDALCGQVGEAHDVDFEAETIGNDDVESGKKGWDKLFTPKKDGDSHFLGGEGQTYKRKVSAKAGTKLTYFCFIHPWMQGTIKVK